MKTRRSALLRIAAAAAVIATSGSAHAVLLDRGPQDPTLFFPLWYRDLNGLALKECLSTQPSPNPNAGNLPMCFPQNPDPLGFPGNVGPEVFYSDVTAKLGKAGAGGAGFSLTYVGALEGSYIPAGKPVHGTESVFARVRVLANVAVAGTYKVTHPYGVEVFPNVQPGARAIFFTADVPVGPPLNWDLALGGRVGPFAQWDFVDPGFVLDFTNPATGVTESFVGDPNIPHTFTGSPFGTNFIRVDGPVGSNLDGAGNDFIQTPLAAVLGQKWLAPIPTPLSVKRATYSRDPVKNLVTVDVYAKSAPGAQMIVTGNGLPSAQMVGDATGNYFAHIEAPGTTIPPAAVLVTNMSSTPVNSVTAGVTDLVEVTKATYDTLTNAVAVTAVSSDKAAPPTGPAFTLVAPWGGLMAGGAFSTVLPLGTIAPESVTVQSSAGGVEAEDVVVVPGLPMNPPLPPVAVADTMTVVENTTGSLDLSLNDVVVAPATAGSVMIISAPTSGVATAALTGGVVTYKPNLNYFGPDSFTYVLADSTGKLSNLATVTVNVTFVPSPPTPVNDDFAMIQNGATPLKGRAYNVVANDLAPAGTAIDPASVKVTVPPLHGTAVANLDGTVTYTPALKWVGGDTFAYSIANTAGGVSATSATVTAVTFGGAETLAFIKVIYTVSKTQWNITGSTNWFGPTLLNTKVTCWNGKTVGGGALLGTTGVDTAGKFALVPPSLTTPGPDLTKFITCQSSNGAVVSGAVTVN